MGSSLPRTIVLKLGGSLLEFPQLRPQLTALLAELDKHRVLIVPGGGRLVDVVRRWDVVHELQDDAHDQMAIAAMSLTANLLTLLLPGVTIVDTQAEADTAWQAGRAAVWNPQAFADRGPDAPPKSWDVTSDSLAAWLATQVDADELLLAKSTDIPDGCPLTDAANGELVDRYFPTIASRLPTIRWCNLRRDPIEIVTWIERPRDDDFVI